MPSVWPSQFRRLNIKLVIIDLVYDHFREKLGTLAFYQMMLNCTLGLGGRGRPGERGLGGRATGLVDHH